MDRLLSDADRENAGSNWALTWLELAAEANGIGFFNWEVQTDKLRWNRGAEERLGLEPGTISSFAGWSAYVHPDDVAKIKADIAVVSRTRSSRIAYKYRFRTPWREQRRMEGSAHCVYDDDGVLHRIMGVNIDVTDREHDREALARSEEQMRSIVETVPDAMVVIDSEGRIRSFNRVAERLFQWKSEEVVGKNISILMPPDLAASPRDSVSAYLGGTDPKVIGQTRMLNARRADGSEFPIELNVAEGIVGSEHFFTGFIRDLSERMDSMQKLEDLRDHFLRASRLNTMGEVAAGLAHELNQPLFAAVNYLATAEILSKKISDAQSVTEVVNLASNELSRVSEIIKRLRNFLSGGKAQHQHILIEDIVREAIPLAIASRDRSAVDVTVSTDPSNLGAFADRIQTQQVLVNLIRNAFEAVSASPQSQRNIRIICSKNSKLTYVRVEDDGPGFSEDYLTQRYLPFTSTKGSEGMGLGLSICRRIIEAQAGTLTLGNRPEGGAYVQFTLPSTREME